MKNVVGLIAWREISPRARHVPRRRVEAESLKHLSAKYCHLVPPPRSTIAAAFSPDGRKLASTHGDHTVKIIDCQTGSCLKVLSGHRRTPWVVRFHPLHPEIIASGSLDHEVRLWDLNTSECIGSRDFHRPIASIAFHAKGDLLAVASGHKVNDLDSSDSSMTLATSPGYLQYPSPAVFVANVHSSERLSLAAELPLLSLPFVFVPPFVDDPRIEMQCENGPAGSNSMQVTSASMQFQADANAAELDGSTASPMETFSSVRTASHSNAEENADNSHLNGTVSGVCDRTGDSMETDEMQAFWELPFLQGWLTGQSQASFPSMLPLNRDGHDTSSLMSHLSAHNVEAVAASLAMPGSTSLSGVSGRSGLQHYYPHFRYSVPDSGDDDASLNTLHDGNDAQPIISRIQSEITTSLAAAAAAELPCTVKLSVWSHDIKTPCALLNAERCRLTIPHAVLCSEMGAHFSPCGRFLAACVACMLPHTEADFGLQSLVHQDSGIATSPTRHPISAHQVMYELRIYSLEEATFGLVLVSRAIRAAHCLTSIQFSPTSEHILLAYGRRHGSLLKSIVIDGETTLPIYTVLEVYRVSDMELVRVLPSAEDEVNVACFHPFAGGGLVYGTKEGKLRVLQFDGAHGGTLLDQITLQRKIWPLRYSEQEDSSKPVKDGGGPERRSNELH
ncbi:Transducin family protein / WD-40 repeat family protein [Prunus dulcis]|uniref:Transducin family protein / WD-40 repeat family protein n=1 Tax=Prunus dulcis TaxID=3755 RepID=A0A4Y1S259_PRUDU|nr:Transducin family protein / WD-40 repeat family protein [Prunus dulcis]